MWEKVRNLFEKHRRIIMGVFIAIVIAIWILQPLLEALPFEVAMAVTTSSILMFVIILLDYVITINRPSSIEIYKDENKAKTRLENYIKDTKPKKVQLIEYSTGSIDYLLRQLYESGVSIELLICNPWEAISEFQRIDKICPRIRQLPAIIKDASNFKIICYPGNASIRGRKFDNRLVALSWYTYEIRDELINTFYRKQIWGDTNPILVIPIESSSEEALITKFDSVFYNLWENGVPLEEVCQNCKEKCNPPPAQWLKLTNPR